MKRSHGLLLAAATMIGLMLATSLIAIGVYSDNKRTERNAR